MIDISRQQEDRKTHLHTRLPPDFDMPDSTSISLITGGLKQRYLEFDGPPRVTVPSYYSPVPQCSFRLDFSLTNMKSTDTKSPIIHLCIIDFILIVVSASL